jgi:hypothetical protein
MKKIIPLLAIGALPFSSFAASLNGFDLTAYGFIKASAMYSTQGLASYNNINLSAPTNAAARIGGRPQEKSSRMSFQTQQSRIGTTLKKGENLSARIEMDFIDFNKSSPTTQMNPRVRIASVTYAWDNHKVIVGQDWDLFSPVTSYTVDYVGLYFLAGNTGFMRQQAQYLNTQGQWEFGGALGMAGNNPGTADSDLEISKSPTYALRASRLLEKGRVGVSAIYGRLNYETQATGPGAGTSHDAYAGNAFYEQVFQKFEVKTEAYYGQNLANLGSLSIGKGTSTSDVKEYGATLTGVLKVIDRHNFFGGVGFARIDNRSQMSPYALNPTTVGITAPGVRSNFLKRVGHDFRVTEDLSWLTEVSHYDTTSKISDNRYQRNGVWGLETGVQMRF